MADLASVDPAASVDDDVTAIAQRFPGFMREGSHVDVAIDHPLFKSARFYWTTARRPDDAAAWRRMVATLDACR